VPAAIGRLPRSDETIRTRRFGKPSAPHLPIKRLDAIQRSLDP